MRENNGHEPRAINPLQGAAGQATVWTKSFRTPARPPLGRDISVDVCIVGAGISGLSVAYQLAKSGASVAVLDDGAIGSGMTSRTTAHLSCVLDDRFSEIERMHGLEAMRLAARSHADAIDAIERTVTEARLDCDFVRLPAYLFLPEGGKLEDLDRDLESSVRAGIEGVERVDRAPLDGFDTGPCNRFARQATFHPLKYLAGLVDQIERLGGRVYPTTRAEDWSPGNPMTVTTSRHATVTAGSLVFATNVPINERLVVHTKQAPYMTHVIVGRVPQGAVPNALYWDLADPYHYVRLARAWREEDVGHDLLVVGGEDYKTGQGGEKEPMHSYAELERWARRRFPAMGEVLMQWSGQVMEPVDGLPFIGRAPLEGDHVYLVTGDSGMGMTHGTIAGMLISDLVLGRSNPLTSLYDPSRKAVASPLAYARENLNVAAQFLDWLKGGDVASLDDIPRDCGAVVRHGLGKSAVYRDFAGELHVMSAACPHLGCIVEWNHGERTWDCPCHGSRFDAIGKVISGPANSNLAEAEVSEEAASGRRTDAGNVDAGGRKENTRDQ